MLEGVPEDLQRWTAERRVALVSSILKGETSVAGAGREHGLEVSEGSRTGGSASRSGLKVRFGPDPRDEEVLQDEQIKRLEQKVGELVLGILQAAAGLRPSDPMRIPPIVITPIAS